MVRKLKEERIGMVNINKFGSVMKIIRYDNANNLWVQFEKGKPILAKWEHFCDGGVKSPYDKSVLGVGYIGEGEYKVSKNRKITPQYSKWVGMLKRCYDQKFHKTHPTYIDCSVAEEWHNFQTFAEWYDENYYEVEGEKMELDKDILVKGNKIYSPDTCVFVPQRINSLFVKNSTNRGELPIGVTYCKRDKRYISQINTETGRYASGGFKTAEDAFQFYKDYKEKYIKQIAADYKTTIPLKLYITMINYEVEIND